MNQTIAKLDVAPSRQQKRGISGQRVFPLSRFIPDPESACLVYNLNVPIKKAKDPPWFAVQMGSVADSVVTNIQIIVDNTIIGRGHRHLSFPW